VNSSNTLLVVPARETISFSSLASCSIRRNKLCA
jgi:hypothetical protein